MSMEDRSIIRQRHGIENARKIASASVASSEITRLTVIDGFGEVLLSVGHETYPAGMTPDQARMLAAQLVAAARRVEANQAS